MARHATLPVFEICRIYIFGPENGEKGRVKTLASFMPIF